MLGHGVALPSVGAITLGDVGAYLGGKPSLPGVLPQIGQTANALTFGQMPKTVGRMAGSKIGRGFARAVPGLALATNVLDVGDIIAGDTSLANKAMDATAMGLGGTIGGFLGGGVFSPLTASVGAGIGKTASDSLQWLFGDKKSAEQRRMEEALLALRGGVI